MIRIKLNKNRLRKNKLIRLFCILVIHLTVVSCHVGEYRQLKGIAFESTPLINARVQLIDSTGRLVNSKTDIRGKYQFSLSGISAPLLVSVSTGNQKDCLDNTQLRPICLSAYIHQYSNETIQIANINPLTDKIVSDLAIKKGFIGPQQWVNSGSLGKIDPEWFEEALAESRKSFAQALSHSGIDTRHFDPATYSHDQHEVLSNLLSLIHHNRSYDNNSGETGHVTLTDFGFRPIVGLHPLGGYEPLDLAAAKRDFKKIENAKQRIFIIGDSTSAVYERYRFPRMGWGQSIAETFSSKDGIAIMVASRAGRSSRDFYNGRWFAQIEKLIKPGDYLLIAFGHNDQNCDETRPLRGAADVKNLCTYPNTTDGSTQFPKGHPELSFENSLAAYIAFARSKEAKPVLITPSTRIKDFQGLMQTPVVPSHTTVQNAQSGYWATGDYTQTIKNLAKKLDVPLLDLESASRNFVNSIEENSWKDYWMVVNTKIYPYYIGQQGSTELPDGTHFQKKGADKMSELLLQLIEDNSDLIELATLLGSEK